VVTGSRFRAVLFDWDGTLADTAEATYRCYVRTFEAFEIRFDREVYAKTYSPNWYDTFRSLGLPEHRWAEADERWLLHFAEETVALMNGAREVLERLVARGIDVAVVTSGTRDRVMREMERHGVSPLLRACVFGTDVSQKKPHPEALLHCLDRLMIDPADAAYVGDSPEDIAMARAANVFAVAVPGGFPNRDALLAAGPDAMVASVRDVLDLVGLRPATLFLPYH
jgi:HAD superfamily hydrolase (TIGR01509 family)